MLVDSHCHLDRLDLAPYQGSLTALLKAAKAAGVNFILCVSVELEAFPTLLQIARHHPNVAISVGLHPTEHPAHEPTFEQLVEFAQQPEVVAIGETGLDYYREESDNEALDWQRERFRCHINVAKAVGKPLIVHTRQAQKDTLAILREEGANEVGGVMHCFTEDWETAQQAIKENFYISFSGIVTFRNAQVVQEVARKVPLDRMLIETDAPYLAPVPYRGKTNEPAYVNYVAECIAKLRGVSFEQIAQQTTDNFFNLFRQAKLLVKVT